MKGNIKCEVCGYRNTSPARQHGPGHMHKRCDGVWWEMKHLVYGPEFTPLEDLNIKELNKLAKQVYRNRFPRKITK